MKKISLCFILAYLLACSCKKGSEGAMENETIDSLGTGWTKIPTNPQHLIDLWFIENVGFSLSRNPNAILKSTDGAQTWKPVQKTLNPVFNIAMGDAKNAIGIARDVLYITRDGGLHFDSIQFQGEAFYDAFYAAPSTAYATGKSIWKTQDAGESWNKIHQFVKPDEYPTLYFINEQTGWASAADGLYKTTDGGLSWEKNPYPLISSLVYAIFFVNEDTGYIVLRKKVLKTSDGGNAWEVVLDTHSQIIDIHFVTSDIGYANTLKTIYKTTDGGVSWNTEVNLPEDDGSKVITELFFIDANNGYAIGSHVLKYQK